MLGNLSRMAAADMTTPMNFSSFHDRAVGGHHGGAELIMAHDDLEKALAELPGELLEVPFTETANRLFLVLTQIG